MALPLRSQVRRIIKCLIVGDSRARGLEHYITHNPPQSSSLIDINIEVKVRPGANLDRLDELARQAHNIDLILIVGGICSLTRKNGDIITYPESVKNDVIQKIDSIYDSLGERVHVATIPPVNLISANKAALNRQAVSRDILDAQETKLLEDIKEVNAHIINKNKERDCPTLLLAKTCYRSTKKKDSKSGKFRTIDKFKSAQLTDGVHPGEKLRAQWQWLIKTFIEKTALRYTNGNNSEGSEGARSGAKHNPHTSSESDSDRGSSRPFRAIQNLDNFSSDTDSDHGAFRRKRRKV